MVNCSNTVVSANTMRVGKNDGGGGHLTPDFGMIIRNNNDCVIKDNTLMTGALKELVVAADNENCIVSDNIGTLTDESWATGSRLLN